MTTYVDLAIGRDEIKTELPIAYVLEAYGYEVWADGGEYTCRSPFREDSNPSFRVWASTADSQWLDRWNDFAEGTSGDVFDLIGRFEPGRERFVEQMDRARELLLEYRQSDWSGPTEGAPRKSFDVDEARQLIYAAQLEDPTQVPATHAVTRFLSSRADQLQRVEPEWLIDRFGVGGVGDMLVIPYWTRDGAMAPALKTRFPGSIAFSQEGSTFSDILYGEWLDTDPERPVVLCEGETDVWSGTHASAEYVFLGLPTGAGAHPKQAPRLARRRVLLALDGDKAGRGALRRWAAALVKEECTVEVVPLPDGQDLADVVDVPGLLAASRRFDPPLRGVTEIAGRYRRLTQDDQAGAELADFSFTVQRAIRDAQGGLSFQVAVSGRTLQGYLQGSDLTSAARLRRWCLDRGLGWAGNDKDTAALASLLRTESLFAPNEEATSIAGLYDGHFVWPGGVIGDRPVLYVPPTDRAVVPMHMELETGPYDVRHLADLRELAAPAVVDPVLAWLAVAPVRSLFRQFPILNVAGGSGTGKTTLLETVIPLLTGSTMFSNLTGTTRFAMLGQIGATNAFPVVFDEYRPGARTATLSELNQLLRDAYTGQPSMKGGSGDAWNRVQAFDTHAPIVVAGEDAFSETSHTDRMILVRMPPGAKPAGALERVQGWAPHSGLAYSYLSWLVKRAFPGEWRVVVSAEGPDDLNDRQRYNLGVLRVGWYLLQAFCEDHGASGLWPDEPDWSGITTQAQEAAQTNPIREALAWAVGDIRAGEVVWVDEASQELCVVVESFVAEVNRQGTFVLPGGAKAVRHYLTENYNAHPFRRQTPLGRKQRGLAVPLANIDLDS